jgi:hypothetical protein
MATQRESDGDTMGAGATGSAGATGATGAMGEDGRIWPHMDERGRESLLDELSAMQLGGHLRYASEDVRRDVPEVTAEHEPGEELATMGRGSLRARVLRTLEKSR